LQDELTEASRHRAAISEVLRVIASSPYDLQSIFHTIVDRARHLCRADVGSFRIYEEQGLRLVAYSSGAGLPWSPKTIAERNGYLDRLITQADRQSTFPIWRHMNSAAGATILT
jgi:hypothetical protein